MKKMQIFEPALCCSTGVCGVSVDPELLRISTVLSTLKSNGVEVDRFNLSSAPEEFINNKVVSEFLNNDGVEDLPITLLDGEIKIVGRYPTNIELVQLLNVPISFLGQQPKAADKKRAGGCDCSGGGCC
ncbi:MAG: arsenite efflux transporter metallochaperone ArsD [Desulfitobacterium hafniense]|nr:arsenite efflux transporter metallochaperone ArsD [Desulfitobacterium hafniense]